MFIILTKSAHLYSGRDVTAANSATTFYLLVVAMMLLHYVVTYGIMVKFNGIIAIPS